MSERFFIEELANGLTVLGQQMPTVSSAALTLAVRCGSAQDPPELAGASSVACEWCLRGAGGRSTRELHEALDALGCQHHESVRGEHLVISAAQLSRNLDAVLGIVADLVCRPELAEKTFGPSRALVEQDLAALADEPARLSSLLLRERFYPWPLGRCVYGSAETLAALEPESLRQHIRRQLTPAGAILAVAGDVEFAALGERVRELFGDWSGSEAPAGETSPPAGGVEHVARDSAQVHIALASPAAVMRDERYYAARMAEMVLSGGASARLHTEVREKRGLAYHVATHYHSLKDHAGLFTYAGTRPEIASQTFEQVVRELRRLADGVGDDEIARAQTQLRSALVMQGESTSARAHALASDWYHLGRLRSLSELSDATRAVTAGDVLDYLAAFPADRPTALVLGPEPIDTSILDS